MINIIKNTKNTKDYDNQSYNDDGISYATVSDNKTYQLKQTTFGSNLMKEFYITQTSVEKYCKRDNDEDKAITNIFNSLYSTMLILSKIIDALEPIYYLPSNLDNEKENILEIEENILQNKLDLDPSVYLFYENFFMTNFESLLMHSHSLLDKIAIYIKDNKIYGNNQNEQTCFGQILSPSSRNKNYYFSDLIKKISELAANNSNNAILNKINSELYKLNPLKNIIIPGEHKTLRNKIVHQETVLSLSASIFAVYRYKNKFFKFDNFLEDINAPKKYPPVVECIDRILKNIIDFNLNVLNTILNDKFNLLLNTNITNNIPWINPFYNHQNDIKPSNSSQEIIKMNTFDIYSKGFILQDIYYIKKKVFTS